MAPNEPNKPADLQMPDTTGKKEGDTWKVTENGVEVTYTIPAGNGNQSVDRTWTNSAGGTSTNRMVDDGAGGFQSWTDSTNGPATYMNKGQGGTTDGVYGQVYDPGNSTSGTPDVGFGGNPNLSQVEAVRYDENGNPVDRLNSSRNSRGNWDSGGFDSEGNRTLFGDIPDGKGGFVQGALVGQVNQEGYGWSTDPEGTRWNIAPDPSGDPGALLHWRTETTKDSNTLSIYVDSRGVEKREVRGLCSNEVLSVGYLDIDGVYTHFDYSKQTKSTYNPHDYTLTVVQVDEGPQWSRTTTPSGERSREAAGPLLGRSIYGSQDQDYDQVYANLQYLPIDDELRKKEVDRLLAAGIPASQVQNVLWQKAVDARSRLASAGISLLTVEQARALEATDRSYPTDPRRPFVPDHSPYVSPSHKFNEGDFRELLGDFTGLNDLQEGLLDGNYGQAAFGAGMTILTFTPGAVFKPLGKGLSHLGGKLFGETEQVLAAELGTLGKSGATGGRAGAAGAEGSPAFNATWKLNPETSPFIPEPANPYNAGTHLGAGAGARAGDEAVPAILDYPKPGELPWNTREVIQPPVTTPMLEGKVPPARGPSHNPWNRPEPNGILGSGLADLDPFPLGPQRPRIQIPRRDNVPGAHGSGPHGGRPGVGSEPGGMGPGENPENFWDLVMPAENGKYRWKKSGTYDGEFHYGGRYADLPKQELHYKAKVYDPTPGKAQLAEDNPFVRARQNAVDDTTALQDKMQSKLDEIQKGANESQTTVTFRETIGGGREDVFRDLEESFPDKLDQIIELRASVKPYHIKVNELARASEDMGEVGAIAEAFADTAMDYELVSIDRGPGVLDLVFVSKVNGKTLVVDAKGGGRPNLGKGASIESGEFPGERVKALEGTTPYVLDRMRRQPGLREKFQELDREHGWNLEQQLGDNPDLSNFEYRATQTDPSGKITNWKFNESLGPKHPGYVPPPGFTPRVNLVDIASDIGVPIVSDLNRAMLDGLGSSVNGVAALLVGIPPLIGLNPRPQKHATNQTLQINITPTPQPRGDFFRGEELHEYGSLAHI
ncbi:hypothetical protein [Nocardia noduli]|uniref:hypothetical protein n=1 Tax=Nocardia noduli TaxID=2815722 RepID=UPI001C21157C|nr:hypothetical protein [Nocardia noduli]